MLDSCLHTHGALRCEAASPSTVSCITHECARLRRFGRCGSAVVCPIPSLNMPMLYDKSAGILSSSLLSKERLGPSAKEDWNANVRAALR